MTIARGDIILFKSPQRWQDRLICRVTGGPYYHVAIALDATHIIEALGSGITMSLAPINPETFDLIELKQHATTEYTAQFVAAHTEDALDWCVAQRGKQYGWLDIAYQGVKFLFPNNPFQLTQAGHMDCSDFVTRYIAHTGYPLPDMYSDPYKNTPADIARLFNLLPARKAVLV